MTGKKYLILLGALALVSLGASTAITWLRGPGKAPPAATSQPAAGKPLTGSEALLAGLSAPSPKLLPKQEQLEELVRDLRGRLADVERRQHQLDDRERRLAMAEENLRRRAKEVEKLIMQLSTPLTRLQKAQAELQASRVVVGRQEKANLERIAATFEKMDAAQGSGILEGMCKNGQSPDVVKILYYMSERGSAKLLGEMTDRSLAATLTGMMQRIREAGKEG